VSASERTGRIGWIAVVVLVAVLAFAGGVALRAESAEDRTVTPPAAAQPLDAERAVAPLRLVRADPGRLRRPPERKPVARVPPPAPVAPAAPAPAPPPPVVPEAAPPLPDQPRDEPTPEPAPVIEFDLEG
jgi:hypothetical protein